MENMVIYEAVREVPEKAQSIITAGRIKGFTDINPMWRIKKLTEQFGPCGIGWKYVIKREWTEVGANNEIAAFMDIDLYIKYSGEWSEAIPGTGGSMFVTSESKGMHTSDECYKSALTDAISVACKALGFGADIYWNKDESKYDKGPSGYVKSDQKIDNIKKTALLEELHRVGWPVNEMLEYLRNKYPNAYPKSINEITEAQFAPLVAMLRKKPDASAGAQK